LLLLSPEVRIVDRDEILNESEAEAVHVGGRYELTFFRRTGRHDPWHVSQLDEDGRPK
jgi:hypothetical protein